VIITSARPGLVGVHEGDVALRIASRWQGYSLQEHPRLNYVRREQKCRLVKDFSDYHPQIPAF
jgi:hypothetical protein